MGLSNRVSWSPGTILVAGVCEDDVGRKKVTLGVFALVFVGPEGIPVVVVVGCEGKAGDCGGGSIVSGLENSDVG